METNMQYLNEYIVLPINVNGELLRCVPNLSNSLHSTEYISAEEVVVSQEPELLNAETEYITFELQENPQLTTTVSFECPRCEREFFDNQQYTDHLKSHENEFNFVCEKCNESFSEKSLYQSHLLNHQEEKLFNCTICHKGFNYENNFKVHMALHRNFLTCPICDLKFHRTASLKAHVALHQVEELHSCPECPSEFDTLMDLRRHMKTHIVSIISQPEELICNYCKVTFETSTLLKQHIASHVKVKNIVLRGNGRTARKLQPQMKEHKHKCTVCNKSFPKFSLLERHTRIHSGERPFVCEICQKGFSQKSTLQIHLTKHSGVKPYSCTLCPAKFNQKYNLSIHVRKTHSATSADEKVFKCKECDCIFKKLASLNGHVTRVHPKDNGKITIISVIDQLKNLGKQLNGNESSSNTLNKTNKNPGLEVSEEKTSNQISRKEVEVSSKVYSLRQKFVGTTKVYICPYCNKETKKPSDLIRHIRTHTKEKPYRCHCGNAFSLKSTLLSHMQVHKGKIGRKCLKCSRIFFSMKLWNTHLRSHDETEDQNANVQDCERLSEVNSNNVTQKRRILEKTQKCHMCSASFLRKENLKRHMLLHTGERKYKCEICSRTFIAAYSLKEHMKCHTGMRDFGCELCDKKFFNKSLLKRHILIHYKTKPYQCSYCKKRFKNSTDCDTHSASHHKANTQDDKQVEASIIYSQQNDSLSENVISETAPIVLEVNTNGEIINNFENAYQEEARDKNLNVEGTIINPSVIHVTQSSDLQTLFVDLSEIRNQEQWNNYYASQLKIQPNDAIVLNNINEIGQSSIVFNVQTIEEASLPVVVDMENEQNQEDSSENLMSLMSDNLQERLWLEKTQEITNESLSHNDIGDDFLANNASLYPNTEVTFNNTLEVDDNNILIASEGAECLSVIDEQNNFNETLSPMIDSPEESIANLNVIQCSTCNKIFNSATTYQAHIRLKSDLKKSNLDKIDSVGSEKTNLEQDHETVTSGTIPKKTTKQHFRCVYCGKEFLNRGSYIIHCQIHKKSESNMHKCEFCGKPFKKPSDLARHLRTHTGEKPFACDQCDKKFSLKSTLEGHYNTHNPETTKKFVCEVCNSFFSSKNGRKLHMLCHTGSKPEKCSYCDERFRTRAHKRSHEKRIHINRTKVTSQSKTKRITNILATAADMAISAINGKDQDVNQEDATGLTEIQLEFPDQINPGMKITESIQIDQALLQQLQNSNILLQNIEEIAPTSVIQMSDGIEQNEEETALNGLELFENNVDDGVSGTERNLECEICHKHYASKDVLRKHMQLHTMYKYVCEKCSKWFSSPEALLQHEKVHSGYRPFSCFLCTNTFAEAHHLKIHLKRIHQIVDTSSPLILKIATGETLDI